MLYYIEPKGAEVQDYLAENAIYIGASHCDDEPELNFDNISFDKIHENKENDVYLACLILNKTWYNAIAFVNLDAVNEITKKYAENKKLWYWISYEKLKPTIRRMDLEEFNKSFRSEKYKEETGSSYSSFNRALDKLEFVRLVDTKFTGKGVRGNAREIILRFNPDDYEI